MNPKDEAKEEWEEILLQNYHATYDGVQYVRQLISQARKLALQEAIEGVGGIEMPKWNGCYDERCKDRACNLCKNCAEIAELDKKHILSKLQGLRGE